MRVLILAGNDSDNIMIDNVLVELQARKHELKIFAISTDEKSIRMFTKLNIPIYHINAIKQKDFYWADCIFSALRSHTNIGALGDNIFCKKYIFVYNHYIENHWFTPGADFMFTCGEIRKPVHLEDCPYMPIGCPKNDHLPITLKSENIHNILFIDSGHFPFSHIGKSQVANMLLKICYAYPNYTLTIKPRFLPSDSNLLHANTEHLYDVIEKLCNGHLPDNLILLQRHCDMQELLDQCCCAVMLTSSAYVDAALRKKNILIVEGLDNEEKYELRNEIEYKNIYDLRRKSGCVVHYRDILKYLPKGLPCSQEHLNALVKYKSNASHKIVDVMEFIYVQFLKKGIFPSINAYSYETFKQEMKADPLLSWEIVSQKRLKNMGNDRANVFNRISVPMDNSEYYEVLNKECFLYPLTKQGALDFFERLAQVRRNILINNKNKLMNDAINQSELFRALYEAKEYDMLLNIPQESILCCGAYSFYLGKIFYQKKDYGESLYQFSKFINEFKSRTFAKYECEEAWIANFAFKCIAERYDENNISPYDFKEIYETLYQKKIDAKLHYKYLKRLHEKYVKLSEYFYEIGDFKTAFECAQLCLKQVPRFNDERKKSRALETKLTVMLHNPIFRLHQIITFIYRKILGGVKCTLDHGIKYTSQYFIERLKRFLKKLPPFKIFYEFRSNVYPGFLEYSKIILEWGDDTCIYLSARSTGDVYISALYYEEYKKINKLQKQAVYALLGDSCYQVAQLFNIQRATKIDKSTWNFLLKLMYFLGESASRIKQLYYTGYIIRFEGYKDWNLHSIIYAKCFDNIKISSLIKPTFKMDSFAIEKLFEYNDLLRHRTVVLCPYAGWAPPIPFSFWQKLSVKLQLNGFTVCTNLGSEEESVIPGTAKVCYPLNLAVPFVETAGYVVGIRSGFLDIIESAVCKKVALYPYNCPKRGVNGFAMGSFSLNAMFGKEDFLELETTPQNLDDTVDEIIDYFINE